MATPDETTGKETEFSLVGSLEINKFFLLKLAIFVHSLIFSIEFLDPHGLPLLLIKNVFFVQFFKDSYPHVQDDVASLVEMVSSGFSQ